MINSILFKINEKYSFCSHFNNTHFITKLFLIITFEYFLDQQEKADGDSENCTVAVQEEKKVSKSKMKDLKSDKHLSHKEKKKIKKEVRINFCYYYPIKILMELMPRKKSITRYKTTLRKSYKIISNK